MIRGGRVALRTATSELSSQRRADFAHCGPCLSETLYTGARRHCTNPLQNKPSSAQSPTLYTASPVRVGLCTQAIRDGRLCTLRALFRRDFVRWGRPALYKPPSEQASQCAKSWSSLPTTALCYRSRASRMPSADTRKVQKSPFCSNGGTPDPKDESCAQAMIIGGHTSQGT